MRFVVWTISTCTNYWDAKFNPPRVDFWRLNLVVVFTAPIWPRGFKVASVIWRVQEIVHPADSH